MVYALAREQRLYRVDVPLGTTLRQAIERSHILDDYPAIDLSVNKVGVFGELCDLNDTLQPGDRIEIYRPLQIDPKTARRAKALKSGPS